MPRPPKPLSREDLERAMRCTRSNRAAAKFLRVSFPHYKKYAKLYTNEDGVTYWELHYNQSGKGIPKFVDASYRGSRKYKQPPIADILEGRVSPTHYDPQKLKQMIIQMGFIEPKCSKCGYDTARIIDGKVPLILNHIDGDVKNWKLDNLEFMCYNCSFHFSPNAAISEQQVQAAEDFVEKNRSKIDWEISDYHKEVLEQLGLEKEYKPGSEYISRI